MSDLSGLRIDTSRPKIPGNGPQSIATLLSPARRDHPERIALVGRGGRLTYAELDAAVRRGASTLSRLGLRPGDRLAACLPSP